MRHNFTKPIFRELVWVGRGIQEALGLRKAAGKVSCSKAASLGPHPPSIPCRAQQCELCGTAPSLLLHGCGHHGGRAMVRGPSPHRPEPLQAPALTGPSSFRPRPSQAHSVQGYIQRVPECLSCRGSAAPHSAGQAGPSFSLLVPTGPAGAHLNRGYTAKLGMET